MTSTAEHSGSNVVPLPSAPEDGPSVRRHGLGYRGVWPREGFLLDFDRVELGRGGSVQGLLSVSFGQSTPFVVQFNAAVLNTRTSVARHLQKASGFDGWATVLDFFCRHVIRLASRGNGFDKLTDPGTGLIPTYRLDPIIPKNVATLLYGPSGSMKSTLAAAMTVSVSAGVPLLDWQPEQAPVLVVDWETDIEEWGSRVGAICRGLGTDFPEEIAYHRAAGPLYHNIERIADQVTSMGAGLVVVDSLGYALGGSRDGGDPSEPIVRMFGAMRYVETTWLLIDHVTAESAAQNGAAKPYGSIYKVNSARSSYELRREKYGGLDGIQLRLHHYNVNRGPTQADRGFRILHGAAMIEFAPCEVTAADLQGSRAFHQRMRDLLALTGALQPRAIADELGENDTDAVRKAIKRHPELFVRLVDDRVGLKQ